LNRLERLFGYLDINDIYASLGDSAGSDDERIVIAFGMYDQRVLTVRGLGITEILRRRAEANRTMAQLGGELGILDGLLHTLTDLGTTHDASKQRVPEQLLEGSVDLGTYTNALRGYGYSTSVLRSSWRLLVGVAARQALGNGGHIRNVVSKAECELPVPLGLEEGSYPSRNLLDNASIDVGAFTQAVGFVNSFGDHYNQKLEAIKRFTGDAQPETNFRYFIAWTDFAAMCSPQLPNNTQP